MSDRDALYTALRNADRAGDTAAATKLAAYIKTLPVDSAPSPPADAPAPDKPFNPLGFVVSNVNLGAGHLLGVPIDTEANVVDLAKAGYATLRDPLGMLGVRDPSIPDSELPAPVDRSKLIGSGQYIENAMRRAGVVSSDADATSAGGRIAASALQAIPSIMTGRMPSLGTAVKAAGGAALSGGAAQGAAEAGLGPSGQILASLTPGAAHQAVRPVQEAARKAMLPAGGGATVRDRIAQAQRAGVENPSAGMVTGSRPVAMAEGTLARLPGGGSTMDAAAEARAQGMGKRVTELVERLSPGGAPSAEEAGVHLSEGIQGAVEEFRKGETERYAQVDKLVPAQQPVRLKNFIAKLDELTKPTPGAEATTGALKDPTIKALYDHVMTDLAGVEAREPDLPEVRLPPEPKPPGPGAKASEVGAYRQAVREWHAKADAARAEAEERAAEPETVRKATTWRDKDKIKRIEREVEISDAHPDGRAAKATLPYAAVRGIRSSLGTKLGDISPLAGAPTKQYKALYKALMDDVRAAMPAGSPQRKALEDADTFTREGHARIDRIYAPLARAKTFERATSGALAGTKQGASALREILGGITPAQRDVVGAYVVDNLGKANPSAQNAEGSRFEPQTFLTNWNKLHPDAQKALFPSPKTRQDLADITKTVESMREAGRGTYNPSGTARAVTHAGMAGGVATAVLESLFHGNVGTAAGIAGAAGAQVAGTRYLARAMSSPEFIHWLAEGTKAPVTDPRAYLARLITIAHNTRDPETAQAIEAVAANLTGAPQ